MPEVTYFSVMILLVFGSVTDTLFYKAFFSVSTLSQLLSGTVPPLCTIVSGGKSNCFAPTMCTGAQDDKYTNIYS